MVTAANGFVGIGNTTPQFPLDINGPAATAPFRASIAGTEVMRIDSSGNLGVGTNSPNSVNGGFSKLVIYNGNISIASGSNLSNGLNIFTNGQTTNNITLSQGWATTNDNIGYLYNRANADFVFATNNTERMRITAAGNIQVASGSGITFNSNPGGLTQSTLNDYEVGTYTPTVSSSGGTIGSYTCAGYYTKVGRMVHAGFQVVITSVGTATGIVAIGLPFAVSSSTSYGSCAVGREIQTTGYTFTGYVTTGVTSMPIITYNNGSTIGPNYTMVGGIAYMASA